MALSIRDVLTTWRELEHQLKGLVDGDERAEDIKSQIAVLRGVYGRMVDTSDQTEDAFMRDQVAVESAREILRRHFLVSWGSGKPRVAIPVDWGHAIERLLRGHAPEGRRCHTCGGLPDGVDPVHHQAEVVHDRLVHAGVVQLDGYDAEPSTRDGI
jgi:hypothetical protein